MFLPSACSYPLVLVPPVLLTLDPTGVTNLEGLPASTRGRLWRQDTIVHRIRSTVRAKLFWEESQLWEEGLEHQRGVCRLILTYIIRREFVGHSNKTEQMLQDRSQFRSRQIELVNNLE